MTIITNAKYITDDNSMISALFGEKELFVPTDATNRHFRQIIESNIEILPYQPVEIAPHIISFIQMLEQMGRDGWITPAEMLSWAKREALPSTLVDVINTMPENERPFLTMRSLTMNEVERSHQLVYKMAELFINSTDEGEINQILDTFFINASKI